MKVNALSYIDYCEIENALCYTDLCKIENASCYIALCDNEKFMLYITLTYVNVKLKNAALERELDVSRDTDWKTAVPSKENVLRISACKVC